MKNKIDENLDAILKASGSSLQNYTMPSTLEEMREVMRGIMWDSRIDFVLVPDEERLRWTITTLEKMNEWRRYNGEPDNSPEMPCPIEFGEAIDFAVFVLRMCEELLND